MHTSKISNKAKIAVSASIILAVIISIFAIIGLANTANAEESKALGTTTQMPEDNKPIKEQVHLFYGMYLTGLNGEMPVENTDYKKEVIDGVPTATILKPNWVLTGVAVNEDNPCKILINTSKIYFKNVTIGNEFMTLEVDSDNVTDCEIVLLEDPAGESNISNLTGTDNVNLTLSGNSKLHIGGSDLDTNNLTINNVTLEVFNTTAPVLNKGFLYNIKILGDLTMNSGRLVASNVIDQGGASVGIVLKGKASLNNGAELFSAARSCAVAYAQPGTFADIPGSEDFILWFKDRFNITEKTIEGTFSDTTYKYTRALPEGNGDAKTISNIKLEPTPEPVTPTQEVTAQTGDATSIALLGFAVLAMAGFCVCMASRKRSDL